MVKGRLVAAVLLALAGGCDSAGPTLTPPSAGPRPGASVPVALPMASGRSLRETEPTAENSGEAAKLPPARALQPYTDVARDLRRGGDVRVATLRGVWSWRGLATPHAKQNYRDDAKRAWPNAEPSWKFDFDSSGRLRVTTEGGPTIWRDLRIEGRAEWLGWLVHSLGAKRYRVLVPGVVMPFVFDGQPDAFPRPKAKVASRAPGEPLLGMNTVIREWKTDAGALRMTGAQVFELGLGPVPLCRLLVELAGVATDLQGCTPGFVPLLMKSDVNGSKFEFRAISLARRSKEERGSALVRVPLPGFRSGAVFARPRSRQLVLPATIRTWLAIDTVRAPLLAVNNSTTPLFVLVDGVAVGLVVPGSPLQIDGYLEGAYGVEWRTAAGLKVATETLKFPGKVVFPTSTEKTAP